MNGGNSSSMKCPACGLVNWATAGECKRCKTPFAQGGGNSKDSANDDAPRGDWQTGGHDDQHSTPGNSAGWSPSPVAVTTYGQQDYGHHQHGRAFNPGAQNHLDIEFEVSPFVRATTTFRDTYALLSSQFKTYAKIVMVAVAPLILLTLATGTGQGVSSDVRSIIMVMGVGVNADPVNAVATFLSIIAYHFITLAVLPGAIIYGIVTRLNTGESPSLMDCFSWGLKRSVSAFTAMYLYVLAVILGYICLIVPGVIMSLALSLVIPITVIEGGGPIKALKRSYHLTKGRRGTLFCSFFLWGLLIMGIGLVSGFGIGLLDMVSGPPLSSIVQIIVSELLDSTGTLVALVIYLGLAYEGQFQYADASLPQTPAQQWA